MGHLVFDLTGKTAVVTSATSGIGHATATLLGKRGARLVVNGRGSARLDATVARVSGALGEAFDLSRPGAAAALTGRRIRVNTVSPGPIETPAWSHIGHPEEEVAVTKEEIRAQNPLGHFGSPEELPK